MFANRKHTNPYILKRIFQSFISISLKKSAIIALLVAKANVMCNASLCGIPKFRERKGGSRAAAAKSVSFSIVKELN